MKKHPVTEITAIMRYTKYMMQIWSVIMVIHLSMNTLGVCSKPKDSRHWAYFVYTQQWAPGVCIDANMSHQHQCQIPKNVTTWIIHGLWPNYNTSTHHKSENSEHLSAHHNHQDHLNDLPYPQFCNNSAKFNEDAIKPLLPQLHKYWPNLYTDTPPLDFWKHEWTKHGTCAMDLPATKDEYAYFNTGLKLCHTYDILKVLTSQGIVPKKSYTYQYMDVIVGLKKALGVTPEILCVYDKETKTQYFDQIRICLKKDFTLMECQSEVRDGGVSLWKDVAGVGSSMPCRDTEPIAYPPVHPSM